MLHQERFTDMIPFREWILFKLGLPPGVNGGLAEHSAETEREDLCDSPNNRDREGHGDGLMMVLMVVRILAYRRNVGCPAFSGRWVP